MHKSAAFWFPEGNFVFIASRRAAYRVHGDVLGRKSKVFKDMLSLAEVPRPDSEDVMEGCPVVHVTDSPEDFRALLSFIYDGFQYASFFPDSSLCLRLTHNQVSSTACTNWTALDKSQGHASPGRQI